MHYQDDIQGRERKLTRDFIDNHQGILCELLCLKAGDRVVIEFQKSRYRTGVSGDVDIAVWKNPNSDNETFIGIEVKTLFLEETGTFKSEKPHKHDKQIRALEKEGWDFVYFFDFIISKPANGWLHPQAFEGHDNYRKEVESKKYGHVVFQVNPVAWKPESMAGSISPVVRNVAEHLEQKDCRVKIRDAMMSIDFSRSPIVIDSV